MVYYAHFLVQFTSVFLQILSSSFVSNSSIDASFSMSKLTKSTLFRHKASKSADCTSMCTYEKNVVKTIELKVNGEQMSRMPL